MIPSAPEPPQNRPGDAQQDIGPMFVVFRLCPASRRCFGSVRELCPHAVPGGAVSGCSPAGC
eukprot:9732292-Alexandrium_andersonii.AAC.1